MNKLIAGTPSKQILEKGREYRKLRWLRDLELMK